MTEEKTTGLLLQATPYLGQKKILKILSPEHGLITVFANRNISPVLTTPFVFAEWIYKKNQREIFPLTDGSLIDDFAALKKNYSHLLCAGEIANALLKTQFPNKTSHEPLILALSCFRKLPLFQEPSTLLSAFRLKLLYLEGLISTVPIDLENLFQAKSFTYLASLPKNEEQSHQTELLFTEAITTY